MALAPAPFNDRIRTRGAYATAAGRLRHATHTARTFANDVLKSYYKSNGRNRPSKRFKPKTMPYRRRGRTRTKRRFRRRRRGLVKRRVPRPLVPYSKVIKMRTTDYQTLGGTAIINILKLAVNDITDPFLASGAQRPLYYNELKTLYRTAIVLGAKVKVKCHNSGTPAIIFGITQMPYDYSATIDSYEYAEEVGRTKSRILSSDVDHGYLSYGIGMKKHFRVANLSDSNRFDMDIENNSSPNKKAEIFVWAQCMDQTSAWTADCHVTIDFIVLARDPFIPTRS